MDGEGGNATFPPACKQILMQFKTDASETNGQDIVSEINALCDSNATSYPIASKVRRANMFLEELVALILESDGEWQFDDSNHTNLPVGTINLAESQADYSFNEEFLAIEQALILTAAGNYRPLTPIDPRDFKSIPVEEYFAATGLPTHYDILGDTIILYPAPIAADVTLTAGLKVRFKRTIDLFTTTDTTQEPGIPSTHHSLIAYMVAIPYCMAYKPNRVAAYERKVESMKSSLVEFYARRHKTVSPTFSTMPINVK